MLQKLASFFGVSVDYLLGLQPSQQTACSWMVDSFDAHLLSNASRNHASNRLKQCREQKGLSQKEVALTLGVSVQAISYWENDSRTPSKENLQKLSQLYEASVDYLLGFQPTQQTSDPQSAEEYELLLHFRKLSFSARELVLQTLRLYASNPLMIRPVPIAR